MSGERRKPRRVAGRLAAQAPDDSKTAAGLLAGDAWGDMTQRITTTEYRRAQGIGTRRKPPVEREHFEQVALFKWAKYQSAKLPELALLFAIPNGGKRSKAVAGKLKAEGVKAGVPDICLPIARGHYHGLFIELKTVKGRVTAAQEEWMRRLKNEHYFATVCFGWEQAKKQIEYYLQMPGLFMEA